MSDASESKDSLQMQPLSSNGKKRKTLIYLTVFILLLALIAYLAWFFYFRLEESTDDAYVNGNLIEVTSLIPGVPIAFYADDTDLVEAGQILVVLDSTLYQLKYEKELSNLAETVLQVKQLYDQIKTAELQVRARRVQFDRASFDLQNRQNLISSQAISNEDFVHAKDTLATAELELRQAEKQLEIIKAAAGPTIPENHPLIETQKTVVREAFYNLQHCTIVAPTTGYIAKRAVEVGQWVAENTPLMAVIPLAGMWLDANFKETQLKNMRIGQPARVTIDLYGKSVEYMGKVVGISFGTGSVFSLLPPQNATGNWIKIVQRLPVRILLDPEKMREFPLRLGLSAQVVVDIQNVDLPAISKEIYTSPICSTTVFQIDFSMVNQLMDRLIAHYLFND